MNSKEEFTIQMKTKVAEIEEILKRYLPEAEGYQKVIMEAMEYSLMAGGKRLRPMLMQETCRLFGEEPETLKPFMAALEMIHTYSLVHDDLPAMDNDEYRRGRKTTPIHIRKADPAVSVNTTIAALTKLYFTRSP